MITPFGRFTRKLRVEHGEVLKDMAPKLGISYSYLCAAEIGKRGVPLHVYNQLAESYDLTESQQAELSRIALAVNLTKREKEVVVQVLLAIQKGGSEGHEEGLRGVLAILLGKDVIEDEAFAPDAWCTLLQEVPN